MRKTVYRFGDFELDPKGRELRIRGEPVAIAPKPLDCVIYLIERRDRAVGRDELISGVWGRADVSDHLLAQTLLGARRALGDVGNGGGERRAIATVPRFGYRWLAPTDAAELDLPTLAQPAGKAGPDGSESLPAAVTPSVATRAGAPSGDVPAGIVPPPAPAGARARWRYPLLLAAAALAIAGALSLPRPSPRAPPSAASVPQPAGTYLVLPVALPGGDPDAAWLRLGAMEYIAERLREDAGLRVLSSQQALAVGNEEPPKVTRNAGDIHRVRSTTGASHVIAPRAVRSGNAWAFELDVYYESGLDTFSGIGSRPLAAATEAVRAYAADLGITTAAHGDPQPDRTERLQRIDAAFLKGDLRQARGLIDAAPAADRLDPELTIRDARVAFRSGQLDAATALFEPLTAEDRGLSDDLRARAYLGLGGVAMRRADHARSRDHYSRAIALLEKTPSPSMLGTAHMERANVLGMLNDYDAAMVDFGKARIEMERAGDRYALGLLDINVGLVESYRNRWEAALTDLDRGIETATRYGVDDALTVALLAKSGIELALVDNTAALATTERFMPLLAHLDNAILARRLMSARVRALMANARLADAGRELEGFLAQSAPARADPQFDLLRAEIRYRAGDFTAAMRQADGLVDRILRRDEPTSEAGPCAAALVSISAAVRLGVPPPPDAARWLASLPAGPPASGDLASWDEAFCHALARAESSPSLESAAPDFALAFALADGHGHRDRAVLAGIGHIRRLLHEGRQLDQALVIVGRLAPLRNRDYRVALAAAAAYRASGDRELAEAAMTEAIALGGDRMAQSAF